MKKLIPLILACVSLLTGCGGSSIYANYREVEHLLPVQTLGIDASEAGTRLSVSGMGGGSTEGGGSVISREGDSIISALRSLQNYAAEQELYYSHCQYLLLGEGYAGEKAGEALDFVARDNQLRLGLSLFAVRGEASELISGPGEEKNYEISKVLSSVVRDSKNDGLSHVFSCRETIRSLSRSGAALVCALSPAKTEKSVFPESKDSVTAVPWGYGVLREGKLVGWIEPDISQAASLILGHPGSAGPRLSDGQGGHIVFEYSDGRVKVQDLGGGRMKLSATLTATLAEPDTAGHHITDSRLLSEFETALSEDMKGKMEKVLALSKELDADFLELGSHLREKPDSWPASAQFQVECQVKIDFSRELADKMGTSGGGE